MILVVILGLASALVYGGSDFLGGLASRQIAPLRVTAITFVTALLTIAAILPATNSTWSLRAIGFGALAGLAGVVGVWLLYVCLAMGPMSVLSPVAAVTGAVVPVVFGITHHESLSAWSEGALGLIVIAAALVAMTSEDKGVRATPRSLAIGVASGLAIGIYLILINHTPRNSGLVPILVDVAVGTLTLAVVAAATLMSTKRTTSTSKRSDSIRPRTTVSLRRAREGAIAAGITLGVGNALLVIGIHLGQLAVMAALSALYPVGTLLLARVATTERMTILQTTGLVLAVAAAALLTLN